MSEFLANLQRDIGDRIGELAPAVSEHAHLTAALAALQDLPAAGAPRRARRAPRAGTRSSEALDVVTGDPGLTTRQIAERVGIDANYMYRVLPGLEQAGKVTRHDGKWYPTATGTPE